MSDVYYEKVTPCEGCGVFVGGMGIPGNHVKATVTEKGFERCPGSGGSRVRLEVVEPDIAAGVLAAYKEFKTKWSINDGHWATGKYVGLTRDMTDAVGDAAVSAAVGGVVLVKETDE